MASWLPRLLWTKPSPCTNRYQQQPEDLAEQLPRIERIQARLRLARNVLEIPEVDRLYGELNKLQELANQPISEDAESNDLLLNARKQQAIAVYQNRAWKTLLRACWARPLQERACPLLQLRPYFVPLGMSASGVRQISSRGVIPLLLSLAQQLLPGLLINLRLA